MSAAGTLISKPGKDTTSIVITADSGVTFVADVEVEVQCAYWL